MIYRTAAFTDKCAITLPIRRQYWPLVHAGLTHAVNHDSRFKVATPYDYDDEKFVIYRNSWTLRIQGRDGLPRTCFIQTDPVKAPYAYMRLEWNPAKVARATSDYIIRALNAYVPNMYSAWQNATVTRADITFDLLGLPIDRVMACTMSSRTGCELRHENDGYLNSFYLGSKRSIRRLLVYDKAFYEMMKLKDKNRLTPAHEAILRRTDWVRCEFRLGGLPIRALGYADNELARYIMADIHDALALSENASWQWFLSRHPHYGTQNALKLITNKKERARKRDALRLNCRPVWFDKDAVWAEGMNNLQEHLYVPPIRRPSLRTPRH